MTRPIGSAGHDKLALELTPRHGQSAAEGGKSASTITRARHARPLSARQRLWCRSSRCRFRDRQPRTTTAQAEWLGIHPAGPLPRMDSRRSPCLAVFFSREPAKRYGYGRQSQSVRRLTRRRSRDHGDCRADFRRLAPPGQGKPRCCARPREFQRWVSDCPTSAHDRCPVDSIFPTARSWSALAMSSRGIRASFVSRRWRGPAAAQYTYAEPHQFDRGISSRSRLRS